MAKRTTARNQFLSDLLTTAVEHSGYGFPELVGEYSWDGDPADTVAVIRDRYLSPGDDGYGKELRITVDTMAAGLSVIRDAVMQVPDGEDPADGAVPHNAKTGQRLYFGGDVRRELLLSDRTNGEDGDYDVIGALAVLECAVYGYVVYA